MFELIVTSVRSSSWNVEAIVLLLTLEPLPTPASLPLRRLPDLIFFGALNPALVCRRGRVSVIVGVDVSA